MTLLWKMDVEIQMKKRNIHFSGPTTAIKSSLTGHIPDCAKVLTVHGFPEMSNMGVNNKDIR